MDIYQEYEQFMCSSLKKIRAKKKANIDLLLANKLIRRFFIPIIKNIFKKGRGDLLTKDFLYYILYLSVTTSKYLNESLTEVLYNLVNGNINNLVSNRARYYWTLVFHDFPLSVYKQNNWSVSDFYDLMSDEDRKAYLFGVKLTEDKSELFEDILLKQVLTHLYGYCYIHKRLDLFPLLAKKYFDNPNVLKEYLSIQDNGNHYYLYDEFYNERFCQMVITMFDDDFEEYKDNTL